MSFKAQLRAYLLLSEISIVTWTHLSAIFSSVPLVVCSALLCSLAVLLYCSLLRCCYAILFSSALRFCYAMLFSSALRFCLSRLPLCSSLNSHLCPFHSLLLASSPTLLFFRRRVFFLKNPFSTFGVLFFRRQICSWKTRFQRLVFLTPVLPPHCLFMLFLGTGFVVQFTRQRRHKTHEHRRLEEARRGEARQGETRQERWQNR